MLINFFRMQWRGIGGVLDWEEEELARMAGDDWKKRERVKFAAQIRSRMRKAMVYSFLQRRISIIFSNSRRGDREARRERGRQAGQDFQVSPRRRAVVPRTARIPGMHRS